MDDPQDVEMMTDTQAEASITPSNMIETMHPSEQGIMMTEEYKYEDERTPESVTSTDSSATLAYEDSPIASHIQTQSSPTQSPSMSAGTAPQISSQGPHHAIGNNPTQKRAISKRAKVSASTSASTTSPSSGSSPSAHASSKKRARVADASDTGPTETVWSPANSSKSSGGEESGALGPPPAKRQVSKAPRKSASSSQERSTASSGQSGKNPQNNPNSPSRQPFVPSAGTSASSSASFASSLPPSNFPTIPGIMPSSSSMPSPGTPNQASAHSIAVGSGVSQGSASSFPPTTTTPASSLSNTTPLIVGVSSKMPRSSAFPHPSSSAATAASASPKALPLHHSNSSLPRQGEVNATAAASTTAGSQSQIGGSESTAPNSHSRSPSTFQAPATLPSYLRVGSSPHGLEDVHLSHLPHASTEEQHSLPAVVATANSAGSSFPPKYPSQHQATPTYGSLPSTPSAAASSSSSSSSYPSGTASTMSGDRQSKQHAVVSPNGVVSVESEEARLAISRRPSHPQVKGTNGSWQGEQYGQQMHSPQQQQQQTQQHQPGVPQPGSSPNNDFSAPAWNPQAAGATPPNYYMSHLSALNAAMPQSMIGQTQQQLQQGNAVATALRVSANRQPSTSTPNSSANSIMSTNSNNTQTHNSGQAVNALAAQGAPGVNSDRTFATFGLRDPLLLNLDQLTTANADLFNFIASVPSGSEESLNCWHKFRRNLVEMVRICSAVIGPLDPQVFNQPLQQTAPSGPRNLSQSLQHSGHQMKAVEQKSAVSNQSTFATPTQRPLAASSPQLPSIQQSQQHQQAIQQQQQQAQQQARSKLPSIPAFSANPASSVPNHHQPTHMNAHVPTVSQMPHSTGLPQGQQMRPFGYRNQDFSPLPPASTTSSGPSYYEALLQHHQPHNLPPHQPPQHQQSHPMEVDNSAHWNTHHTPDYAAEHARMMAMEPQNMYPAQQHRPDPRMVPAPNRNMHQYYPPYGMEGGNHYAPNLPHWSPSGHHPNEIAGQSHGGPRG